MQRHCALGAVRSRVYYLCLVLLHSQRLDPTFKHIGYRLRREQLALQALNDPLQLRNFFFRSLFPRSQVSDQVYQLLRYM